MIALYILLGLFVLILTGWVYQRVGEAKDQRNLPPTGKLVDIGGYMLHLNVSGSGSPTVILEAGFGDYSIHWKEIQRRLEQITRVVSYDRAGMGWSDPSPHRREPSQVAEELYKALKNGGIDGPYIIMGHSLGGLFARHFARNHLDEMAGVLLLDSFHEKNDIPDEMKYVYDDLVKTINAGNILVPIGVYRLITSLRKKKEEELTETEKTERTHALRTQTYRAYKGEFNNVMHPPDAFEPGSLKDLPLVVLYAEANITEEAIKDRFENPAEIVQKTREVVKAGNEQLGTLSSRSQVLMSPAGHYIQRDDPNLVVDKIKDLIEMSAK